MTGCFPLRPFREVDARGVGASTADRPSAPSAGQRILEIGCGTGNLTILVKTLYPAIEVVGLDPDPKALDRARRKADRSGYP